MKHIIKMCVYLSQASGVLVLVLVCVLVFFFSLKHSKSFVRWEVQVHPHSSIQKQIVSVFGLNQNKQKNNQNSVKDSIFWIFS